MDKKIEEFLNTEQMYADIININIPIKPTSWQSTRFAMNNNGKMYAYQPKKIKDYKDSIVFYTKKCLENHKLKCNIPTTNKVKINVCFIFNKKIKDIEYKTTKPDLADNLMKPLMDALNAFIWVDDSQIIEIESRKINMQCENDEGYIILQVKILND